MNAVFRIAPTPSGYLHEGNIFNFLINALWAKKADGNLLLRIDDMDSERMRPEYVGDIFFQLDSLGIEWQLGPTGPEDFYKNWSQQLRMDIYVSLLNDLKNRDLLFACNCTRSELARHHSGQVYSGKCMHAGHDLNQEGMAWRMKVSEDTEVMVSDIAGDIPVELGRSMGSFVVKRKDGKPAYQVCSVADDLYYGVTHVARGADLLTSTAAQLFLANAATAEGIKNTHWYHHPLKLAKGGEKISKSTQASGAPMRIKKEEIFLQFQQFLGVKPARVGSVEELYGHLTEILSEIPIR